MTSQNFLLSPRTCAHLRTTPCVYIAPTHHRPRPDIGRKASKHIRLAYTETKKFLSSFNFLETHQKKSQRREAALLILEALFQFTDFISLEIGIFFGMADIGAMPCRPTLKDRRMGKDSFSLLREINRGREPHQTITYGRMMRALGDLKRAGYLDVRTRAVMNRYGKIRATVAIKKLTQKVFKELGISLKEIGLERERKLKNILKEKERTEKMTKEKAKEIHAFILAEKEKYHPKPIHQLFLDAKKEVSEENVKELQRLHPDLTPRELAMMLVARIKKKPPDP